MSYFRRRVAAIRRNLDTWEMHAKVGLCCCLWLKVNEETRMDLQRLTIAG